MGGGEEKEESGVGFYGFMVAESRRERKKKNGTLGRAGRPLDAPVRGKRKKKKREVERIVNSTPARAGKEGRKSEDGAALWTKPRSERKKKEKRKKKYDEPALTVSFPARSEKRKKKWKKAVSTSPMPSEKGKKKKNTREILRIIFVFVRGRGEEREERRRPE